VVTILVGVAGRVAAFVEGWLIELTGLLGVWAAATIVCGVLAPDGRAAAAGPGSS
jgi:hypothetical protein